MKPILIAVMTALCGVSQARIIGTNPTGTSADIRCDGGRVAGGTVILNTEVCIDSTGSEIPTATAGTQNLGTSALPWLNVFASGTQTTGAAGTTLATGLGGTAATQIVNSGLDVKVKYQVGTASGQNTGINISTTIPVNSSYETLISSGSAITLTSTPSISTSTIVGGSVSLQSGTLLVLSSTATFAVILQDEGTLTGSKLQLGAATRSISAFKTLTLIYDATDGFWREISYGNN